MPFVAALLTCVNEYAAVNLGEGGTSEQGQGNVDFVPEYLQGTFNARLPAGSKTI